jgi:hypothetical protein
MGCCESNTVPDFRTASEQELWSYLGALSGETQYRIYNGFDTGNTDAQGAQAYEALKELNRRFLYTWEALEQELRKRQWHIWLYQVAPFEPNILPDTWEDAVLNEPVVAVLLGSESEAHKKREFHAQQGVSQELKKEH